METSEKKEILDAIAGVRNESNERFDKLESQMSEADKKHEDLTAKVSEQSALSMRHSELHAQHAQLVGEAQRVALESIRRTDGLKAEHDVALKAVIQQQYNAIDQLSFDSKAHGDSLTGQDKKLEAQSRALVVVARELGVEDRLDADLATSLPMTRTGHHKVPVLRAISRKGTIAQVLTAVSAIGVVAEILRRLIWGH